MDNPTKAGMLCPVCRVDLVMADRQNVEIDYCPQCRGVWLDRGELDKIIQRNSADLEAPVAPRPDDRPPSRYDDRPPPRYDDRPYDKRRKRRSLLEDLFDFD